MTLSRQICSCQAAKRHKALEMLLLSLPFLILAWMIAFCTVPVPKADDYDAILGYLCIPAPERWAHIADFHNEHRLLTARIVFEAIVLPLGHFDFTICMAVGALFLGGYGLLVRQLFLYSKGIGRWLSIPFVWLIVSFLNYDNVCWAMTSVSNVQVHFWALLSILLATRCATNVWFASCLLCAFLATFSTGAGMSVWGALAVMVFQRRIHALGSWSSVFANFRSLFNVDRCAIVRLAAVSVVCPLLVCLYFHGFQSPSSGHAFSLGRAMLTFLAFSGAVIPVWSIALMIGVLTLLCLAWIIWSMPRISNAAAFAFLSYLVANILSVAIFRSYDPMMVLACRLRIVPISLLCVIAVLLVETMPFVTSYLRALTCMVFLGVFLYLCAFTYVAYPSLAEQNTRLLTGIKSWPQDASGLFCSEDGIERANGILLKSVRCGIYRVPRND